MLLSNSRYRVMLQTLLNLFVFDANIQVATKAPRLGVCTHPDPFEQQRAYPNHLSLEGCLAKANANSFCL